MSAVDEPGTGFRICAHVVSLENHRVRRLLLRTTVPHSAPSLPSAIAVYAGAEWHERETFEMFGVTFTDHPHLVPLLLPENFEGHPLRKDFVLAARVAKAWPGAKEPGETHDPDAPKRRQMLPPGVPDPNDWGPLKGQLPPAPTRPTRAPRRDGATPPPRRTRSAATDPTAPATAPDTTAPAEAPSRPPRRTRSVTEGSASQAPAPGVDVAPVPGEAEPPARPPRRTRSASDGSASQAPAPEPAPRRSRAPGPAPPRRTRSAADGSASQAAAGAGPDAEGGPGQPGGADRRRAAPRSADAPWHHAKPAFEEPTAEPKAKPDTDTDTENGGDA
ncbi:NADH-quinone oxidoreductase subunit C [Streptomyces goshikiensis]